MKQWEGHRRNITKERPMISKPATTKTRVTRSIPSETATSAQPTFNLRTASGRPLSANIPVAPSPEGAGHLPLPVVLCSPPHLVRRDAHHSKAQPLLPSVTAVSKASLTSADSLTVEPSEGAYSVPADDTFREQVANLLGRGSETGNVLGGLAAASDAFYDFDEYIFLRNTDDPYVDPRTFGSTQVIPADPKMDRFLAAARQAISGFINYAVINASMPYNQIDQGRLRALEQTLYGWWASVCSVRAFNSLAQYSRTAMAAKRFGRLTRLTPENYYGYCLNMRLSDLAKSEAVAFIDGGYRSTEMGKLVTAAFWEMILAAVFEVHFSDIPRVDQDEQTDEYAFDPFPSDEILFGLQVIHRQSWNLLGYGRGELVKSIPLGPRENQKISVKITSRTKLGRTSEEASSLETSSESSTSTKDTAEVVAEASEKLNKHAEAEVSGGYGPFVQAKVSGGISQDLASSSRQTKNRLNEVMQKTAGRMKRDTKVTVSTEREDTYEVSRASELVNPNDEVAVTYMYHRLQQRYWVSTSIAEVHSVVFVPEEVPDPVNITEDWVARHADAISGALLDLGLSGILNSIRKEPSIPPFSTSNAFQHAAESAIGATDNYRSYTGQGTMPDFLASGQQFHERDLERRNTYNMDVARRSHQSAALIAHIKRNILHYMRAIWGSEDYDQRMQRYNRLRVPTRWYFVPRAPLPSGSPPATPFQVDGFFTPDDSSAKRLTDVIDPIGPIGYLFNCAIYRLRDDNRLANTHQALAYLRSNYVRFDVQCTPSNGAGVSARQCVAYAPRSFSSDFTLTYRTQRLKWLLPIPGRAEGDWIEVRKLDDGSLDILGIRIWLDGIPVNRAELTISVRVTSELEDPQVRFVQMQYPLPVVADEPRFFTETVLSQIADIVPAVASAISDKRKWTQLNEDQKATVRAYYHEWIVLRESGRLVPLETSNVVLDLEIGPSPILEPFKKLHRYIDVLKEYEVMRRNNLENERRMALLQAGRLGDPDVEHVTVISTDPSLAHLVSTTDGNPEG